MNEKDLDASESRPNTSKTPPRWPLLALATLLVAIAIWCLALFLRSLPLRGELHQHLTLIADLERLRDGLSKEGPNADAQLMVRVAARAQTLAAESEDPAVRNGAAELLRLLGPASSAGSEPATSEAVFPVLRSAERLRALVQDRGSLLFTELDAQWRSQNALLLVCLLLCASNVSWLYLAGERRRELEIARDEATRLATHDPLTSLLNREGSMKLLRHELARCRRRRDPLGLLLADIDRFKEINVLYGEEQGDVILQQIAARMAIQVRPYDSMGRIGSDSFLIVLPGCDEKATGSVAERLAQALSQDIEHGRGRVRATVSMAFSTLEPPGEEDAELLLYRLREALDRLQKGERGITRVVLDGSGPIPLARLTQ